MSGKWTFHWKWTSCDHHVISIVLSIRSQWFRLYNPIVCEIENNEFDGLLFFSLFTIRLLLEQFFFYPSPVQKPKRSWKENTTRWLLYWQTNVSLRSCFRFSFWIDFFMIWPFQCITQHLTQSASFYTSNLSSPSLSLSLSRSHSIQFNISQYFDFYYLSPHSSLA